jgi:hypothetical protein
MRVASIALPLAGLAATAAATAVATTSSKRVSNGCNALKGPVGNSLFFIDSLVYQYETNNFWSNTELMSPGCVFRPQSSSQLAEGLVALVDAEAKFAVRGGGHMGIRVSLECLEKVIRPCLLIDHRALTTSIMMFWSSCPI